MHRDSDCLASAITIVFSSIENSAIVPSTINSFNRFVPVDFHLV